MIELTLFAVVVYLTIDKILGPVLRRGVTREITHNPRPRLAVRRRSSAPALALLTVGDDPWIIETPRGVELNLEEANEAGADWSLGDVARVIDTIEGL